MPLAEAESWLARVDLAGHEWVAATSSPPLDAVLPRLSRAADHGVLWLGIAAGLGLSRGHRRRAAVRGLLGVALASPAANIVGKQLTRRARPSIAPVPLIRRLRRQPVTSSFPSGHSASAAAFAVGVAIDAPRTGAAVAVVAAAVAYSRVYTGVHYPADVLAGAALGAACAALTTRVWPPRDDSPARAEPASARVDALPDGAGLVVVVNDRAGKASHGDVVTTLRAALPRADVRCAGPDDDLPAMLRQAAHDGRALGVAGGDGTVGLAAQVALEEGRPLAVFPAGTLDHFARDLGVGDVHDTVRAVRDGEAVAVDVGSVDTTDQVFLNTASLGGYPEMVAMRERLEGRLGKWASVVIAMVRVLATDEPLHLEVNGEERRLWLLFAGNCFYEPAGFAPTYRARLDDGLLDVRLVDAVSPLSRTRFVLAVLLGRLGRSRVYESRTAATLQVRRLDGSGPLPLARDGEVGEAPSDLVLTKTSHRLVTYRPAMGLTPR